MEENDADFDLGAMLDALSECFEKLEADLRALVVDTKRIDRRLKALRPPSQGVALHARPVPGRKRGRPKGAITRNRHVFIN
jgi:hypothetical protein